MDEIWNLIYLGFFLRQLNETRNNRFYPTRVDFIETVLIHC